MPDTITLTLGSGLTLGGRFWQVVNQQIVNTNASPAVRDPVTIARLHTARLLAQATVTLSSRHSLKTLELAVYDYRSRQSCTGPEAWQPDPARVNEAFCGSVDRRSQASMIATVQAGYGRYVRAGRVRYSLGASAGMGTVIGSFVETRGDNTALYEGKDRGAVVVIGSIIAGASVPTGRSWLLRLEARNSVTWLPVMTEPVSPGVPLTEIGRRFRQLPSIHVGVQRVLNRGHGRRY